MTFAKLYVLLHVLLMYVCTWPKSLSTLELISLLMTTIKKGVECFIFASDILLLKGRMYITNLGRNRTFRP